jgi:hypothetical protein
MNRDSLIPFVFLLALLPLLSVRGEEEAPITRILDTGSPSAERESVGMLTIPTAWTLIPEDQTNYQFSGDAVLRNDRLAVVLRKKGNGVDIFSRTAAGLKHRAELNFLRTNSLAQVLLEGLDILENTSAGVGVAVRFTEGGKVRFRLTTGEATLEIQSSEPSGYVALRSNTRYVVVPDYFGDDLIYRAKTARDMCLPAENICLNLLDGEDAMIMSVWQSNEQDAWLGRGGGGEKAGLSSIRIRCLKNQKIWVAFFEAAGTWHTGSGTAGENWKPPFPAKWRASFARDNGLADSWDLERGPEPGQTIGKHAGPLIIYPLDRSTSTPLTAICTTDVMRNTLGVGPCQYILACEGLGAQGDPTPNSVMGWVEKQFEQKKQKKAADDISERLEVMNRHVTDARARIERYAEFAARARKSLSGGQDAFRPIIDSLDLLTASGLNAAASPERSRQLASQVLALIGKDNNLEECRRLGRELRSIGAVQDSTLAKCRMAVRRLRAQARAISVNQLQDGESTKLIQRLADQMLQNK